MASLTGNKIKDTYGSLIKTTDNLPLQPRSSGTFVQLGDGDGYNMPIYVSTTSVRFHDAYTFPNADGSANQILNTDGSGNISFRDNKLYMSADADSVVYEPFVQDLNFFGATNEIVLSASSNSSNTMINIGFASSGVTLPNNSIATTQGTSDDSTKIATTAFVASQFRNFSGDSGSGGVLLSANFPIYGTTNEIVTTASSGGSLTIGFPTAGVHLPDGSTAPTQLSSDDSNKIATTAFVHDLSGGLSSVGISVPSGFSVSNSPLTSDGTIAISFASGYELTTSTQITNFQTAYNNRITTVSSPLDLSGTTLSLPTLKRTEGGTGRTDPIGIIYGRSGDDDFRTIQGGANGDMLFYDGSGDYTFYAPNFISSVALSVPSPFTVTGSPITSSGTFAITLNSNYSIPTTANQTNWTTAYNNRIDTASLPLSIASNNISLGTVGVGMGGTGATTLTGILLGNGINAISGITSTTNGDVLTADGSGNYSFTTPSGGGGGDVTKSGTITQNQIAVWNDNTDQLRSDGNITISTDTIALAKYIINGTAYTNIDSQNTGFGENALASLSTSASYGNTAIGGSALRYATTSAYKNVAIGTLALQNATSNSNTVIGYDAGSNASFTGNNNVFIGINSGKDVQAGSSNVILGSNSGSTISATTNNVIISDGVGNIYTRFTSGGRGYFPLSTARLGIRNSDPLAALHVSGTARAEALNITGSNTTQALYVDQTQNYVKMGAYGDGVQFNQDTPATYQYKTYTSAWSDTGKVLEDIRIFTIKLFPNAFYGRTGYSNNWLEIIAGKPNRATVIDTVTVYRGYTGQQGSWNGTGSPASEAWSLVDGNTGQSMWSCPNNICRNANTLFYTRPGNMLIETTTNRKNFYRQQIGQGIFLKTITNYSSTAHTGNLPYFVEIRYKLVSARNIQANVEATFGS